MSADLVSRRGAGPVLTAAALVVLVAGLRFAAPILRPLLLALFLATLSLPLLRWLTARSVRPALAVTATVLANIALLSAFGFAVSGALNGFAKVAPGYLEQLYGMLTGGIESLRERGVDLADWFEAARFDPGQLVDLAGGILRRSVVQVASAVNFITVVVVALIFLLSEMADFPAKLNLMFGRESSRLRYFEIITADFQRYLRVKTVVSLGTGLLLGLWVWVLGVDFPLLWGLLAFLLNYIPVLGSILAAVPAVLLTLVQLGSGRAALVAAGYLVVNFVVGNLLEPQLMGRRFGLSPLVVFLALVFWAWVLGPLGMILAVPLTMSLKIALDYSERWRWLGQLVEPAPRPPRPRASG
jgi:predicted PurR-regulated permease PerM